MKKLVTLITLTSLATLTACASNPRTAAPSAALATEQTESFKGASDDCKALYANYEKTMASYKPKKKSFMSKALSGAGAVVGNSFVASKLIGGGADPQTLMTAGSMIGTAQTLTNQSDFSNLLNAGNALNASKAAYTYAHVNDCDTTVLAEIADRNT